MQPSDAGGLAGTGAGAVRGAGSRPGLAWRGVELGAGVISDGSAASGGESCPRGLSLRSPGMGKASPGRVPQSVYAAENNHTSTSVPRGISKSHPRARLSKLRFMASAAIRAGPVGRNGRPEAVFSGVGSGFFPTRTARKMPMVMMVIIATPAAMNGASFLPSRRCGFVAACDPAVPGKLGAKGSRRTGSDAGIVGATVGLAGAVGVGAAPPGGGNT